MNEERARLAAVLSVLIVLVILVGCPLLGALIEGTLKWENAFPH